MNQMTSTSMIWESGHRPISTVPDEEPFAETEDTVLSASSIPFEVLTTLSSPGRVLASPELFNQ